MSRRFGSAGVGGGRRRDARLAALFVVAAMLVVVVGSCVGWLSPSAAGAVVAGVRPRRLLIVSLPGVTWGELESPGLPNLDRLFSASAVADLTNRTARGAAHIGDGYATVSAGTRAATDATSGALAFETTERFGHSSAGEEFARRTGRAVRGGIVHLGIARLLSVNAGEPYGAKVGALGDALARAGYERAVIANADGSLPDDPADPGYHREAAAALMGSDGVVPEGAVGTDLLEGDVGAPFGVRLDVNKVLDAFVSVWRDQSVVLVEASDLARVDAYARYATHAQHARQLHDALVETDALVGRLLAKVDPARDAVMTISPSHPASSDSVGVVALRTPTGGRGYLRSATTRRTGFVAIVDIAPTILDVFGIPAPTSMEGEPMTTEHASASFSAQRAFLVQANADGLFRDQVLNAALSAYATLTIIVAIGLALLGWTNRHRQLLQLSALGLLAYPTVTYFAAPLHYATNGGATAFWVFVAIASVAFVVVCELIGRRRPVGPLVCALGLVVGLHLVDAFTGQHLEFNTPFGYSPTVGIRIAGIGNQTFAQLAAASVLLAGFIATRARWRRPALAVGLLAVTLVALIAPFFGQNFGAALSATPAFVVFAWLLAGRRVRPRHIVGLAVILVSSGLAVGFVDLLRPAKQRTHIGRFFTQVINQGWSGFWMVIHRKAATNFETFSNTGWQLVVIVSLAALAILAFGPAQSRRQLQHSTPALRATTASLATLMVLGYAFKDSGIAVPAMMLGVTIAVLTFTLPDHASNRSTGILGPTVTTPDQRETPHAD